jgi:hypothetical protein
MDMKDWKEVAAFREEQLQFQIDRHMANQWFSAPKDKEIYREGFRQGFEDAMRVIRQENGE